MAYYLDTSALAKLVVAEPETEALMAWIGATDAEWTCSDIARTELFRAVRRAAPDLVVRARDVLDAVTLVAATATVLDAAARVDPLGLRSLDAIHLATALALGDDLDGIVTYDGRLADAAIANGLHTVRPS